MRKVSIYWVPLPFLFSCRVMQSDVYFCIICNFDNILKIYFRIKIDVSFGVGKSPPYHTTNINQK